MVNPRASPHIERTRTPTIESSSGTSSSRCVQCNAQPKEDGRNLVVCIDGTSNKFGLKNTNVVKLYGMINQRTTGGLPRQRAYYSSGIGTHLRSSHIFKSLQSAFDMAVAWSIGENVKEAYGWLAKEYQEGDQIYLFGFSRGAYQVRILAGMIYEVGLLRTPTEHQIETAYDQYVAIRLDKPETIQLARDFKDKFSWDDVRAHFVGVWDTVSSVGGGLFHISSGHACHFRHALALDEFRVKFAPEYAYEINPRTDDEKSKEINASHDAGHFVTFDEEVLNESVTNNDLAYLSDGKKMTSDVREVWFAGSHSDVGGTNRPGRTHNAGNVSLLWMRHEAAANGLALKPTNIIWVPDDVDFGTSDSMTALWLLIEYLPIKHRVSFGGTGADARRMHKLQPRRIIPGQKVHASILHAKAYESKATIGWGFDIPIIQPGFEDTELDNRVWETGFFDDSEAKWLVSYLGRVRDVEATYLDRLLFMLRFEEGKQCIRNVPGWQRQLMNVIRCHDRAPLVRLVVIVAYYEASCNPEAHRGNRAPVQPIELPQDILDDAKKCLGDILAARKHRDGPRVAALLRPLMKRQLLREYILTPDVLMTLLNLLDVIVIRSRGFLGQVIDSLDCLLQCEETRLTIVEKLGANSPGSNMSRLSRILRIDNPRILVVALRMALTLAQIPNAQTQAVCSTVKPRIRELASRDGPVGRLAVELSLALYDPTDRSQLDIADSQVRANLVSVLVHCQWDSDRLYSANGHPGHQILCHLFGIDAIELMVHQKKLLAELMKAVQKGSTQERITPMMALLKLCETPIIRAYLCEINVLEVFVSQLRHKNSALLAAYALSVCLKYSEWEQAGRLHEDLPKHLAGMLRLGYFDDSVGSVGGYTILADILQHAELRERLKGYGIVELLNAKLGNGTLDEIREKQKCLQILGSQAQLARRNGRSGSW